MSLTKGILTESIFELAGKYPDVPYGPGVDSESLIGGDKHPVFLTLPVAFVNSHSRNDRWYDRAAVEAMVSAINEGAVIGQAGHLRDDDRPYVFEMPPLMWVGAILVDGVAWAKAYVLPFAQSVREYIRAAKSMKAKIGTSIYGTAEVDEDGRVYNLTLESIDLAHPARLGITKAAAVPILTSETVKEEPVGEGYEFAPRLRRAIERKVHDTPTWEEITARMADAAGLSMDELWNVIYSGQEVSDKHLQAFASVLDSSLSLEELRMLAKPVETSNESEMEREMADKTQLPAAQTGAAVETQSNAVTASETEQALREQVRELTGLMIEAKRKIDDYTRLREMLGVAESDDAVLALRARLAEINGLRAENLDLLQATITAEVAAAVAMADVRPVVEKYVKDMKPVTKTDVKTGLDRALDAPEIKTLLKWGVRESMGPNQERPATPSSNAVPNELKIVIPGVI